MTALPQKQKQTCVLACAKQKIGRVIGRQGETIRALQVSACKKSDFKNFCGPQPMALPPSEWWPTSEVCMGPGPLRSFDADNQQMLHGVQPALIMGSICLTPSTYFLIFPQAYTGALIQIDQALPDVAQVTISGESRARITTLVTISGQSSQCAIASA